MHELMRITQEALKTEDVRVDCACGWRSEITAPVVAHGQFEVHLADVGVELGRVPWRAVP